MPPLHRTKLIQELPGGAGLASQHLSLDPPRGPFPRLLAYPSGAVCHLTYPGAFTLYPSLCSCPHPASRSTFPSPCPFSVAECKKLFQEKIMLVMFGHLFLVSLYQESSSNAGSSLRIQSHSHYLQAAEDEAAKLCNCDLPWS